MKENKLHLGVLVFMLLMCTTIMKAQTQTSQKQALNARQQSIIAISGLTAVGNLEKLSTELGNGLDAGLTVEETI